MKSLNMNNQMSIIIFILTEKTILASDFDETTYYCGKYMYHESLAVKKKMFDLNFLIASNSNETTTIQKAIELLTKGNYFVTGNIEWTSRQTHFKKDKFTDEANLSMRQNKISVDISHLFIQTGNEFYTFHS
jgi:hypothetical protein